MRTGITVTIDAADRSRLEAIVGDRNRPQKHVWRAQIILLTADGVGTTGIERQTGKDKTCVWRWQERFMLEGVDGLLRDKTRRSGKPPLATTMIERVVALTGRDPPGRGNSLDCGGDGKVHRHQRQFGAAYLAGAWLAAPSRAPVQALQRSRLYH